MHFAVLGSGSKGNCLYIEHEQTALLIDAGFSGKEICHRLSTCGKTTDKVQALCLTHEHGDHISGAGVISRRLRIPVYANYGTFRGGEKRFGKLHSFREFETGENFSIGSLSVRSFCISHDTNDPVGYIVSDGKNSLGYLTDTGKTSHLMLRRLACCNALILEFNHDPVMLKNGPYPLHLQQRVRSSRGHLSNEDAAAFLKDLAAEGNLQHLVLAHLSEQNNREELAEEAARSVADAKTIIYTARQHSALPLITL